MKYNKKIPEKYFDRFHICWYIFKGNASKISLAVPEWKNIDIVKTLIFHENRQFLHGHRTNNDTLNIFTPDSVAG